MQTMQCITAEIVYQLGFREIGIYYFNANSEKSEHLHVRFDGFIVGMQAGDIVICQVLLDLGIRAGMKYCR